MSLGHGASVVTNGLVLHLDAANVKSYPGSGAVVNDISLSGNNGTLVNGASISNSAFQFDGSNDYIDCGPAPQIGSSLTGLTVSIWVRPGAKRPQCILENGDNYFSNTFYLFQENSDYFTFEVYGTAGGSGDYDVVFTNYIYQINTWYYLTGVWSANNRVELYSNGVLSSGTRGGSVRDSVINGNSNLWIGRRPYSSYPFTGSMGAVKIYNRALSAAEIKQNFEALRGRYGV